MEWSWVPVLWGLVVIMVAVGLIGTILPAIPGVPLIYGGLFLAAYIGDFQKIGWITLTILGVMALLALAIDFLASLLGAKRAGASKLALVGAAIGSILGIFSGLWGLLIFPFIGAVIGEWIVRQRLAEAGKVGVATWLGMMVGVLAKLAIALAMIGIFIATYLLKTAAN
jgi:uncharacterized protein